jgi:hypothetical protein
MDKNKKTSKPSRKQNVIESIKDIGNSAFDSVKKDILKPEDIMQQLFGTPPQEKQYTGEIAPGESVELRDVYTGKRDEELKLRQQLVLERKLNEEERIRVEKKSNQLRIQLKAITEEVSRLSQSTQELAQEVNIAAMQAPVEPGIYHLIFFEKLLEFVKSFRKKVEEASVWLCAANKRAQKKNYWNTYKKQGAKFLLSADHYLTRSAG